jgi:hypothetical protein
MLVGWQICLDQLANVFRFGDFMLGHKYSNNFCMLYFSRIEDYTNSTEDCKCYEASPISHQDNNS